MRKFMSKIGTILISVVMMTTVLSAKEISTAKEVQGNDIKTSVEFATNYEGDLILKPDGTLWAWGDNSNGRFSNNGQATITKPIKILSNVVKQDDMKRFVCKDGSLWAFVGSGYSPLVKIMDGVKYASQDFIVKSDGTVYVWGYNSNAIKEIFKIASSSEDYISPVQISGLSGVKEIEGDSAWVPGPNGYGGQDGGGYHALILKEDGKLYSIGANNLGQLGNGTTNSSKNLLLVTDNVKEILLVGYTNIVLKNDKTLWGWGSNDYAALGAETWGKNQLKPIKILDHVKQADVTAMDCLAITESGELFAWGCNQVSSFGQNDDPNKAVAVNKIRNLMQSVVNLQFAFVGVDKSGNVWMYTDVKEDTIFGTDKVYQWGQLYNAISFKGAIAATGIYTSGIGRTYALKADGSVWAWGRHLVSEETGEITLTPGQIISSGWENGYQP